MASYNYTLETFLATPAPGDTEMRIYDKNSTLKYTLNPDLSYFFVKNNLVIIKVENSNDIILNFANPPIAIQALAKLKWVKTELTSSSTPSSSDVTYSIANMNMDAEVTTADGDLACNDPIGEDPHSIVRVFINGVEVNVGGSQECYFSSDGGATPKSVTEASQGDLLYWNGTVIGYQLDAIDEIDYVYLIKP